MQRNKWETAIRCLEVALHPNTADGEMVAAVNGFRRTAQGTPLRDICIEFAGTAASDPAFNAGQRSRTIERLQRENHDFRLKLEDEANARRDDAARLQKMAERVQELEGALAAAQAAEAARLREMTEQAHKFEEALATARHASAATAQRFAEFRSEQGQILQQVNRENGDLRRELAEAQCAAVAPPEAPTFGQLLATLIGRHADGHPADMRAALPANWHSRVSTSYTGPQPGAWIA
jgi:hypothetical protein